MITTVIPLEKFIIFIGSEDFFESKGEGNKIHGMAPIVFMAFAGLAVLIIYMVIKSNNEKAKREFEINLQAIKNSRLETLVSKYGEKTAEQIFNSKAWIGMTKEQLIESKGEPHDKEILETKTIMREIYYYYTSSDKKGYNTYTLENNELVKLHEK